MPGFETMRNITVCRRRTRAAIGDTNLDQQINEADLAWLADRWKQPVGGQTRGLQSASSGPLVTASSTEDINGSAQSTYLLMPARQLSQTADSADDGFDSILDEMVDLLSAGRDRLIGWTGQQQTRRTKGLPNSWPIMQIPGRAVAWRARRWPGVRSFGLCRRCGKPASRSPGRQNDNSPTP